LALLVLVTATPVRADCEGSSDVSLLISPRAPLAGDQVHVLAASDVGGIGNLVTSDASGETVVGSPLERLGGPPWSALLTLGAVAPGRYRVEAMRDGNQVGCTSFTVASEHGRASLGPVRVGWDRGSEALRGFRNDIEK